MKTTACAVRNHLRWFVALLAISFTTSAFALNAGWSAQGGFIIGQSAGFMYSSGSYPFASFGPAYIKFVITRPDGSTLGTELIPGGSNQTTNGVSGGATSDGTSSTAPLSWDQVGSWTCSLYQSDSSGNQNSFISSTSFTVTASTYTVTVTVTPSGSGSVSFNPSATVSAGGSVTLTASNSGGYTFQSFSGDASGGNGMTISNIQKNYNITATFKASTPTYNFTGTIPGTVYPGQSVQFTASSTDAYQMHFDNVSPGNGSSSSPNAYLNPGQPNGSGTSNPVTAGNAGSTVTMWLQVADVQGSWYQGKSRSITVSRYSTSVTSANASISYGSSFSSPTYSNGPGDGGGSWTYTVSGYGTYSTSSPFTPPSAGTYSFTVTNSGDTNYSGSTSGSYTLTVNKVNQSAPTITSGSSVTYGNGYTASANSGYGSVNWALAGGSTASGAGINGSGGLSYSSTGTVVIQAQFAGDANHNASAWSSPFTVTVNQAGQSAPVITSGSSTTYGSSYTASTNGGYGGVNWALAGGSTASSPSINGSGTIGYASTGTVVIQAQFSGDSNHTASGWSSPFTVTVNPAGQSAPTITSGSSFTYGGSYTATANSGYGSVQWQLASGSTATSPSINSSTGGIGYGSVGTVVIQAMFTGDSTHSASGWSSPFTVTIAKTSQSAPTITSSSTTTYGTSYTASANSGFGSVQWQLGSGSTAAGAAINSSTGVISYTSVGTVVIQAQFAGDTNHNASAWTSNFTITVGQASQTSPTITSASSTTYGSSYTATASAGFGSVTWQLGSGSTAPGAAINSSTGAISYTGVGTVVIQAMYGGDANHAASGWSSPFTVTVNQASQSAPTINSASSFTYGGSYTATTAPGGFGAVQWQLAAGSTATSPSIGGSTGVVGYGSTGIVMIQAMFAGDVNHAASPWSSPFAITINKASQSSPTISSATTTTYGSAYTATANSGFGAVQWQLGTGSTAPGAAINSSGVISYTGVGTVVIQAQFAGDTNHNASAWTSNFTITVNQGSQSAPTISSAATTTYGTTYTATASSGFGATNWQLASGSTATLPSINSSGTIGYSSVGTVVIQAQFAGDANHTASPWSAPFTVTVNQASQSAPTINSAASFTYGGSYTGSVAAGGFGSVQWQLASGSTATTPSINSSSGAVGYGSAGTVLIQTMMTGDTNHAASPWSSPFTVTINKAGQSVPTISSATTTTFGSAYTATANSGFGAVQWQLGTGSTAPGAAINSSGVISYTGVGTVVIQAQFAGDTNHNASAWTSNFTITVNQASQAAPTISSAATTTYGTTYTASASSGFGTNNWQLASGSTATLPSINSSGTIGYSSVGTVVIQAQFAGDANHTASPWSSPFTVTVNQASQSAPTINSASSFTYGASYTGTVTAGGFGSVQWQLASGSTATTPSINGSTGVVGYGSAGTVVIQAMMTGDTNHAASPWSAPFTVTINKASQSAPTITSASTTTYGSSYTATANSGFGSVSWQLGTGSTASGAAIDAVTGAVSFTSTGTVVIQAQFAGDTNHLASPWSSNFTITVNKVAQAAPTITSSSSTSYGTTYTGTATAGFGSLVWQLGTGSTATGPAINSSSGVISYTSLGTVVIQAMFSGDTNHLASPWTSNFTVTVGPGSQAAPTFASSSTTITYGAAYTAPTPTNTGQGALTWQLGSGSTATGAAVNASTGAISYTGVGTVVVQAYYAATSLYSASPLSSAYTVTVNKADQPAPGLSASTTTPTVGQTVTMTASGSLSGSYGWSFNRTPVAGTTSTLNVSCPRTGSNTVSVWSAATAIYNQSPSTSLVLTASAAPTTTTATLTDPSATTSPWATDNLVITPTTTANGVSIGTSTNYTYTITAMTNITGSTYSVGQTVPATFTLGPATLISPDTNTNTPAGTGTLTIQVSYSDPANNYLSSTTTVSITLINQYYTPTYQRTVKAQAFPPQNLQPWFLASGVAQTTMTVSGAQTQRTTH